MKIDLRKKELKNFIRLLFESHLTFYDLFEFVKNNDIEDIYSYLNVDLKTAQFMKKLSYDEFKDIYMYFLRNKHKLFKKLYLSANKN